MKKILILILMSMVILIGACSGQKCPECQSASTWSSCNDDAVKVRTAYECSDQTNFECQSFEDTLNCKTEITAKGVMRGSEMVITPTIEKNVKGIINIELNNVPQKTRAVAFTIQEGDVERVEGQAPNLPFDYDGSDGWGISLDTSDYENGLYTIRVVAAEGFSGENKPPLDVASAQIIIKN